MNKLAVIVPFYKRPELTKLCFQRLKRQAKKLDFDVIVAGSEGEVSEKLAKGLKYIETPNRPLGHKQNLLLQECKDYDGVILLGSDDFMSDSIIKMYQEVDCSQEVYYNFDDVYVYSAKFRELRSGLNYRKRASGSGVGRLYTKATLEKMDYTLWDATRPKGLDTDAKRRMEAKGIKCKWVELGKHFLIDIKIEDNITSHNAVKLRSNSHDINILKKHLGKAGEKILEMEAGNERIYFNEEFKSDDVRRVKCEVLKPFNGLQKGDVTFFKERNYRDLCKSGYVTLV